MIAPGVAAEKARMCFIYRGASVFAVAFMLVVAAAQLSKHGARGLSEAKFIGLDLAIGVAGFRLGMLFSNWIEQMTWWVRARRNRQ